MDTENIKQKKQANPGAGKNAGTNFMNLKHLSPIQKNISGGVHFANMFFPNK